MAQGPASKTPQSVTALDLINQAAKDAGALGQGQSLTGEDVNDCLLRLNWMMGEWQRKRWLIYHLVEFSVLATGAASYSIGPGGDMDVPVRPDRIEDAFFRQIVPTTPNNIDYGLEILEAKEDYDRIALKQLVAFPKYLWYDSAIPLGVLKPWPLIAAGIYELHVTVKDLLEQFSVPAAVVVLPPEYFSAIHFNLALRLRAAFQVEPPQPDYLPQLARDALATIRSANAQVPRMTMPEGLNKRGNYNVFSDQIR